MKSLLLIDANSLVHRSFHALPPLSAPDGKPTGALYGLASTLLKTLWAHKPDYVVAAFDRPEPTFRKEKYERYKAHRPHAPEELISQLKEAHNLFDAFGIVTLEKPSYEADDIIGTLVKKFSDEGLKITILTGDLDTLQLVSGENVVVQTPKRGVGETIIYDESGVCARYGLMPKQMTDFKGLVGDPSDNIPGVSGIGPKTAAKILTKYKNLETALSKVSKSLDGELIFKKLHEFKNQAVLSKELATIFTDVPLNIGIRDITYNRLGHEKIVSYFEKLGFQTLIARFGGLEKKGRRSSDGEKEREKNLPLYIVIDSEASLRPLKKKISDDSVVKVSHNIKNLIKSVEKSGDEIVGPFFDTEIAGWLLNPDLKDFSLESLKEHFLKNQGGIKQTPHNNGLHAGQKTENRKGTIEGLFFVLSELIEKHGLKNILEKIEMPLIPVLAHMEKSGVLLDLKILKRLQELIELEIESLKNKIYKITDVEFNINSPKQVSEVLFKKLGLKTKKNRATQTGMQSTRENVLLELKPEHEIVGAILDYRECSKTLSTYIIPLLAQVDNDGRIRTSFVQTGTSTGRLASEKPNLQNLPQESRWSKELRKSFCAPEEWKLIACDYSQLELRLLAHESGDEKLKSAFKNGEDIHSLTAAQVFNIPQSSVTPPLRKLGKTLNFGIVYGMGPRAFSETANISFDDARRFIAEYLFDFPRVKEWQEQRRSEVKTKGYVTNLNGRKRWFQYISPANQRAVAEMERAAINMPIQGLGADVLKLSMIDTYNLLKSSGWLQNKARLLLAIHDELIFEVSDDILKEIVPAIRKVMEQSYSISVPFVVDVSVGQNLGEMKKLIQSETASAQ